LRQPFDGTSNEPRSPNRDLVLGNGIKSISMDAAAVAPSGAVRRIEGRGRTLMPGLIAAHTHIMFETVRQTALLTADIGFVNGAAVKAAHDGLIRGVTSIRDRGRSGFWLKRGIDVGLVRGPRIWPSGALKS